MHKKGEAIKVQQGGRGGGSRGREGEGVEVGAGRERG